MVDASETTSFGSGPHAWVGVSEPQRTVSGREGDYKLELDTPWMQYRSMPCISTMLASLGAIRTRYTGTIAKGDTHFLPIA